MSNSYPLYTPADKVVETNPFVSSSCPSAVTNKKHVNSVSGVSRFENNKVIEPLDNSTLHGIRFANLVSLPA